MRWQKLKLRARAMLVRLSLWSLWPLLVCLLVFGAIYFRSTPVFLSQSKSNELTDNPFLNLQKQISEDVKRDFTLYVEEFIPPGKLGEWQFEIETIVNIKTDAEGRVDVSSIRVELLLSPEVEIANLEKKMWVHVKRKAMFGSYRSWLTGEHPVMTIQVMVLQPKFSTRAQTVFWIIVLLLTVLMLCSLAQEMVRYLTLKTPKKRYLLSPGEFPHIPGFSERVIHPARGTCHLNELTEMDTDEINDKILRMPVAQVKTILEIIPESQKQTFVSRLKVSDSIKDYLIRK